MIRTVSIDRTSDEIEVWLAASERVISRIRAEQMVLLREVARRQVPLADGCRSLAEWVAGRLDMSTGTARTLTSTAVRLSDLPRVAAAASDGDLSYERTVEVARLATSATEGEALEEAAGLDIGGLQRHVAHRRRLTRVDERDIAAGEHVVLRPNLDESRWDLWGTLGGFHGRIVDRALTQRGDALPTPPDGMNPGLGKRRADALVSVCQDTLEPTHASSRERHGGSGGPTPLVTVFVDAGEAAPTDGETGAVIEAGPRVGPDTLERILCSGSAEVLALTADGIPLAGGQAGRTIPPKLRRFVLARDGACTAEGCDSRYRLEPHHVIHYSESQRHEPEELATLCWWHHHIVIHQHGYRIDPTTLRGRHRFRPPNHGPP